MRFGRCGPMALVCSIAVNLASISEARAVEWECPSKSDMAYVVEKESTLSAVGENAYCVSTEPSLSRVWGVIYEYNKSVMGREPSVYSGLILCLPEHLTGAGWYANRCISPEKRAAPSGEAACGNGKREGGEVCDGADLGTLSCAALGLDDGDLACRRDCSGIEASACGPRKSQGEGVERSAENSAKPPAPAPQVERRPYFRGWAVEVALGTAIPLAGDAWSHFHKALGVVGAGARVSLSWFEVASRVNFLVGKHGTLFNDVEQEQTVLGGGCSLEWGVPLNFGHARVTPGASTGLLYLSRSMTRADFPFEGEMERQSGLMPAFGVFARPELKIPKYPRWSVSLELGSEVMLYELVDEGIEANVNAKVSGGVGYAFK